MKIIFHNDFYSVYTFDPAAAGGRLEAVFDIVSPGAEFVTPEPATQEEIQAAHSLRHIATVQNEGLYGIAALAAGAAVRTARTGLSEPAFGLIRPPGHHASENGSWGFCYFNNMAIAVLSLYEQGLIKKAFILDFDLHFGDGTVNILSGKNWVEILNPSASVRSHYLDEVEKALACTDADMIGISAGFDNHREDWGGLLETGDYRTMGAMVCRTARRNSGGCFAVLEGGYNHDVLGYNVQALIEGMSE